MRQCSIESIEILCDKLDVRKPLDFNLLRISPEFAAVLLVKEAGLEIELLD